MSKKYKFSKQDIKSITEWIHNNIDKDIQVSKSYRFECDTDNEIVYLSNKRWTKLDEYFDEWFKNQKWYIPINYTLICILHEIGHIMTKDDDLLEEGDKLNSIYTYLFETNVISEKELNMSYFEIPCETVATQWGVQFYKDNRQKCEELAEMVGLTQFNRE